MIDVEEMVEDEGLALSFLLLFFTSEVIGFTFASLTIDRASWANYAPSLWLDENLIPNPTQN